MIAFIFLFCRLVCETGYLFPRTIWSHWDDILLPEDIHEMVRITRESLINFSYCLLTPHNMSDYLNLESFPVGYKYLHPQGKSDYIRFSLLAKYGGVYVDSTTYVNSGLEMEHFYLDAVESRYQVVAFKTSPPYHHLFRSCFIGAPKNSVFMKEYKRKFDIMLIDENISKRAKDVCKKIIPTPEFCQFKLGKPPYFLVYIILEEGIRENDLMKKENVFLLPENRSPTRLMAECHYNVRCFRNRLLYDPVARSYPFIKVPKDCRTGTVFNMGIEVKNEIKFENGWREILVEGKNVKEGKKEKVRKRKKKKEL